ncbi:MAG TPA: prolyl oligopeptidase family serine peptidase [bacterium]|nr:prolyl oligopeptidase family serine peptidase [bacterium]
MNKLFLIYRLSFFLFATFISISNFAFSSASLCANETQSRLSVKKTGHSLQCVNGEILEIKPLGNGAESEVESHDIAYCSDGLKVKGKLFAPISTKHGASPLPAVVFNHGGVSGIPSAFVTRSKQLAKEGYVVFAPSYRGEDGSEGEIEVAAGEVDDALAAVKLLRGLSYVDSTRIGMAGTSHGGIITLLAAQRDNSIAAAVCAYGVTDTYTWYKYLVDNGFDVSDELSIKVYGSGPEDKPEAFRRRAPALDSHLFSAPILLLYGEKDSIVPISQGKELAAALDNKGKEYEFHIIPDAEHGFLFFMDPNRRSAKEISLSARAWDIMLDFLKRKLR